ncbi:hypothetical protein CA11_07710 [Gimesia maris]|uniref:DUF1559 family PulG-like putative transporter n=1 Tax=Gimesia maris TaxID=122 RepID=UPI001188E3FC|nr:DUF1559 domain-containing protein [Gimesia maris]QDU12989.1 hypothetical protein CA11_07710 [Gimesia maris]
MTRQRWLELGVVAGIITLLLGLLLPAVHQARVEARKSSSKNNLKQIGLALHNYHETNQCFPPGGTIREDGLAMHGWMIMILPFLDCSPFYNWIDFNEPWDSPHHWKVYEIPIPSYQLPGVDTHFTSTGYGLTHYLGNPNLLHRNSSIQLKQIREEIAHNWLAGEVAGNYQPWAYPFNWRALGTKLCDGPNSFGHPAWDGVNILLADGRVSYFSKQTSPEVLKQLMDAPPVPASEQTATPDKRFETDDIKIYEFKLQSDPEGGNIYYVRGLQNSKENLLRMQVLSLVDYEKIQPDEERSKGGPYPKLLFRVDRNTDIAARLKESSLAEDTTPEQLAANVKTLQALQKQLP